MMAARRRIIDQPMVPSVMEPGKLVPDALVPRSASTRSLLDAHLLDDGHPLGPRDPAAREAIRQWLAMEDIADAGASGVTSGKWLGSFAHRPDTDFLGVLTYPKGVPNAAMARGSRRHEVMHGYTEAARRGMEGLPLWSRATAAAPPALSIPMDELGAQLAGGAAFMDIPWGWYAQKYSQKGHAGAARTARALAAAQLARRAGGRAAEFAADHPVLLGAGVGTAYLLNQALAEEKK